MRRKKKQAETYNPRQCVIYKRCPCPRLLIQIEVSSGLNRRTREMKRKRFREEQIVGILNEHEAGVPFTELCRKHGVTDASIYK